MIVRQPDTYVLEVRNIMGLNVEAAEAWKGASDSQYAVPAREETKRAWLRTALCASAVAAGVWMTYIGKMEWPLAIVLAAVAGTSIDFKSLLKKGAP